MKNEKVLKRLSIVIFTIYLLLALWVIIFKCNRMFSVIDVYNLLSKMTLSERLLREINPIGWYINPPEVSQLPFYIRDDILNILIFIPFGMYLSYFVKNKKVLKIVIITFCFSLFLEGLQLFTMLGACSTKDLITNTLGAFIGCIIYKKIYSTDRIKILNIFSIIVLTVIIPLFLYAIVSTINNVDIYFKILMRTF